MFHTIRWRITSLYSLLILGTLIPLGLFLSDYLRQTYINSLEGHMATDSRVLGKIVQPLLEHEPPDPTLIDAAARDWAKTLGVRLTVISPDGVVLGDSDNDYRQMPNHSDRPEVMDALAHGQGSSIRFSATEKDELLYTAVSLQNGTKTLAVIRSAVPLAHVQADVVALQQVFLGATLFVTVLAVLLAAWIAGRTARPVRQLTTAVSKMAAGDLSGPPIQVGQDEIGQLTQAFNQMALQLQEKIEALEVERSILSAVLDKMTDGVIIVDSLGIIKLVNPAIASIFKIDQERVIGRSLAEAIRHYQIYELWQRCSDTGLAQHVTFELNKRLSLQGVATPLGSAFPGSILLLFQDMTRQLQIEAMRRDFIHNVSHELRTPLAALKALTETLRDGALEDPPAAQRFLDRMETEIDALSLMITELLELSRIESGRVPLQIKPTPPIEIILPAYERLCLQAERAGLTFDISCSESLPLVLADAGRVQQVMINLLHNAIKFTPAGGKVTAGARQAGSSVLFWVCDTGIGIPADELPRIFERFYKVDRARSSKGTGLGLAIARHLVEAHQGKIWVESEPDKGSTFYFTIPLV
jgi:two-component system phosphate regulon sensor histidine kinase PhoR